MGYGHRYHDHGHDCCGDGHREQRHRGHDCCEHGHREQHHHGHRDRHDTHGGEEFDERRVIDTIVNLVGERVERMLDARESQDRGRDRGGDEKRTIDLVVSLVAEKVREIIADEFERRGLGRSPQAPTRPETDTP